jgi:predicted AAA+ superfamily ATPase
MPFQRKFPDLTLDQGIYTIRGPRQIGKTSWMKTLLSPLAKQAPKQCFYLSCEQLRDYLDLAELLKTTQDRQWIFLDEISFVKDWARAVKHAADRGKLHTLIITGSNSVDLRQGGERMPGRLGKGGEYFLLPMDFEEFRSVRKAAGWECKSRLEELKLFFKIGGFPTAVAEAGPQGIKPEKSMDIYRNWLMGDVTRLGKQELFLRELLLQIALTMSVPISLQKLAARTQMGSHHTALNYVEILEDCFALQTLYAMDFDTGALSFKKQKKFYFTDPLIYWIAFEWAKFPPPENSDEKLAEMTAHEWLRRRYDRIGYLSQLNGEIDFYLPGQWAIEVKWSALAHNLSQSYKNLRIMNKQVWTQSSIFQIE